MEEAKWKIAIAIEETINVIQRDEDFMADSFDLRKEEEKLRLEGEEEQPRVFLEEEFILFNVAL